MNNYAFDTAYRLPIPAEIGSDDLYLFCDGEWLFYHSCRLPFAQLWCKRSPLPSVPKQMTEDEKWINETVARLYSRNGTAPVEDIREMGQLALDYARKEKP